jgi:hypothetical protein
VKDKPLLLPPPPPPRVLVHSYDEEDADDEDELDDDTRRKPDADAELVCLRPQCRQSCRWRRQWPLC